VFITQEWFQYLSYRFQNNDVHHNDFRWLGPAPFQALNAFCEMANQTIFNSLTQLYSNQYVSATVTSSNLFKLQTETIIHQFITLAKTNLFLSLDLIQNTTQANILTSAKKTNYPFHYETGFSPSKFEVTYFNCSCRTSVKCIYPVSIYDYPNNTTLFNVPGFYTGCYIIEAVLQSTLECFYNQTCITEIQSYFHISPVNVTALDPSLSMKYSYNSTIQQLLDGLMVEEWNTPITYENYYNQCHPIQCTYTYERKNRAIYILTVLLGLMGGLITILKLIVPILIKLITRKKRPRALEHGKMFITILLCYA
jgi:hypothetical protein